MASERTAIPLIVLHSRPYSDSSLIIETFSEHQGRIPVLSKGARRTGKQSLRAQLQMGVLIEACVTGRGEIKSLVRPEVIESTAGFYGESFAMASYISELLIKLTHPGDPHPSLFSKILNCFKAISTRQNTLLSIRLFEQCLLTEMGVNVDYEFDVNGNAIDANEFYRLTPFYGFECVAMDDKNVESRSSHVPLKGEALLAISRQDLSDAAVLSTVKYINRRLIDAQLGTTKLNSRELWLKWHGRYQQTQKASLSMQNNKA